MSADDDSLDRAVAILPPLGGKLRRTRHRGVYRVGRHWVVPWHDEVGVEHRDAFATPGEAAAFARSVRLREKRQSAYTGGPVTRYDREYGSD